MRLGEPQRRIDRTAEKGRVTRAGIKQHLLGVLARARGHDDRNRGAAACDREVLVLDGDGERLTRANRRTIGEIAEQDLRVIDFVVRRQLPLALQQARLGVSEVDFEDLVELLARLIVILALEGDLREHVVTLRADIVLGHGDPLLGRLRRAVGRTHREKEVHVLEHRLAAGLRQLVLRMVAERLVARVRDLVLQTVLGDLRTKKEEPRGNLGREGGFLLKQRLDVLPRPVAERVVRPADLAVLFERPQRELRLVAHRILVEGLGVRRQKRPRTLGIVTRQRIGRDIERIGRILVVHRIKARHQTRGLGADLLELGDLVDVAVTGRKKIGDLDAVIRHQVRTDGDDVTPFAAVELDRRGRQERNGRTLRILLDRTPKRNVDRDLVVPRTLYAYVTVRIGEDPGELQDRVDRVTVLLLRVGHLALGVTRTLFAAPVGVPVDSHQVRQADELRHRRLGETLDDHRRPRETITLGRRRIELLVVPVVPSVGQIGLPAVLLPRDHRKTETERSHALRRTRIVRRLEDAVEAALQVARRLIGTHDQGDHVVVGVMIRTLKGPLREALKRIELGRRRVALRNARSPVAEGAHRLYVLELPELMALEDLGRALHRLLGLTVELLAAIVIDPRLELAVGRPQLTSRRFGILAVFRIGDDGHPGRLLAETAEAVEVTLGLLAVDAVAFEDLPDHLDAHVLRRRRAVGKTLEHVLRPLLRAVRLVQVEELLVEHAALTVTVEEGGHAGRHLPLDATRQRLERQLAVRYAEDVVRVMHRPVHRADDRIELGSCREGVEQELQLRQTITTLSLVHKTLELLQADIQGVEIVRRTREITLVVFLAAARQTQTDERTTHLGRVALLLVEEVREEVAALHPVTRPIGRKGRLEHEITGCRLAGVNDLRRIRHQGVGLGQISDHGNRRLGSSRRRRGFSRGLRRLRSGNHSSRSHARQREHGNMTLNHCCAFQSAFS